MAGSITDFHVFVCSHLFRIKELLLSLVSAIVVLAISLAPMALYQVFVFRQYQQYKLHSEDTGKPHSFWYYSHFGRRWRLRDLVWGAIVAVWFPIGLGLGLGLTFGQ